MTADKAAEDILRAARWLSQALRDHARGRYLVAEGDPELAVFCYQQAAEKALKAVLVAADQAFERTHSLDRLLVRVGRIDPEFLECPGNPERVSGYAVLFRYPNDEGRDHADDEDVEAATTVADWLVARAEAKLAGPVRDLALRMVEER